MTDTNFTDTLCPAEAQAFETWMTDIRRRCLRQTGNMDFAKKCPPIHWYGYFMSGETAEEAIEIVAATLADSDFQRTANASKCDARAHLAQYVMIAALDSAPNPLEVAIANLRVKRVEVAKIVLDAGPSVISEETVAALLFGFDTVIDESFESLRSFNQLVTYRGELT